MRKFATLGCSLFALVRVNAASCASGNACSMEEDQSVLLQSMRGFEAKTGSGENKGEKSKHYCKTMAKDFRCYKTGLPECCTDKIKGNCPKLQPPCEVGQLTGEGTQQKDQLLNRSLAPPKLNNTYCTGIGGKGMSWEDALQACNETGQECPAICEPESAGKFFVCPSDTTYVESTSGSTVYPMSVQSEVDATFPTERPLPEMPATFPTERPLPETPATFPTERPLPEMPATFPTERPLPEMPATFPTERPLPETPATVPTERPLPETPATFPTERPLPEMPAPTERPLPEMPATFPTERSLPEMPQNETDPSSSGSSIARRRKRKGKGKGSGKHYCKTMAQDFGCYKTGLPECCNDKIKDNCPKVQPPCEVGP